MRVIPVLDLAGGRAVHARGGRRDAYAPVESRLAATAGDAIALARAYVERLGAAHLYVADLDAIAGRAPQHELLRGIAALGAELWVDAGITGPEQARAAIDAGAARVVVGLETLPAFDALAAISRAVGATRMVFSLDLRDGVPIVRAGSGLGGSPRAVVEGAIGAGVRTMIVLDLARVGTSGGVDLALLGEIRRAASGLELVAGGGVRGLADLERLAAAGCTGALVATALHDGRLTKAEIDAVRGHGDQP